MSVTKNYYWDEIEEYEDESMEIYGTCLKQYTDALAQDGTLGTYLCLQSIHARR